MAFVPTTDGARVWCKHTWNQYEYGNSLWFSKPDFTYQDLQDLTDMVQGLYQSYLQAEFPPEVAIGVFQGYDMRTSGGIVVPATGARVFGTNVNDILSLSDCVVVTHYTANRGRAYRGRTYIAGYSEHAYTDGEFITSITNGMTLMFTSMKTQADFLGWAFGVRSGQLDGVPRNPAIITPIVQSQVRTGIEGSQRRRSNRP